MESMDELVDIMLEVVCSINPTIRINGENLRRILSKAAFRN